MGSTIYAQRRVILLKDQQILSTGMAILMDELDVLYEHIDHNCLIIMKVWGTECIDDLYDMYDVQRAQILFLSTIRHERSDIIRPTEA